MPAPEAPVAKCSGRFDVLRWGRQAGQLPIIKALRNNCFRKEDKIVDASPLKLDPSRV